MSRLKVVFLLPVYSTEHIQSVLYMFNFKWHVYVFDITDIMVLKMI